MANHSHRVTELALQRKVHDVHKHQVRRGTDTRSSSVFVAVICVHMEQRARKSCCARKRKRNFKVECYTKSNSHRVPSKCAVFRLSAVVYSTQQPRRCQRFTHATFSVRVRGAVPVHRQPRPRRVLRQLYQQPTMQCQRPDDLQNLRTLQRHLQVPTDHHVLWHPMCWPG